MNRPEDLHPLLREHVRTELAAVVVKLARLGHRCLPAEWLADLAAALRLVQRVQDAAGESAGSPPKTGESGRP